MGKMNELELCISDLRNAAQSLNAAADGFAALFAGNGTEHENLSQTASAKQQAKPVTLEQVRAVLAEKSRDGHTAKIRELLERHGAAKLSAIDPKEYAALLAEAEVLGDG